MTFPSPFESNPIPGLQGVAESLEVQRMATALYQGVVEPLEKDKRKVAALKGALVRPVAQSLRAEDSRTLTGMGQRLRHDAEAQVADTDAEIMLLASRLGARQSTGELTAKGAGALVGVPVTPGTGACLGPPPCAGAICALHPLNTPEVPHPADYVLTQGMQGDYWWCPTGGAAGGEGGGSSSDDGGMTVPSGTTLPPSPPVPCEPCPVGVPPGGALPADTDACRKPDNTTAQAVYVVPWLGERARAASAFSECGRKLIAEAQYPIVDAARIAAALSRPYGYVDVVTDLEQPTDPLDGGASIGLLG
jgi:hypothetical protein